MTTPGCSQTCPEEWSPEWRCIKPAGHEGVHYDRVNGGWWFEAKPGEAEG